MKTIKILILFLGLLVSVLANAADPSSSDPLEGMANLLKQEHQHPQSSAPPMRLDELETAALANNPEIRLMSRRIAIAEAKTRTAGSREDPAFMYRGWGTPLQRPWDLDLTQHMFMYNQALPGLGKRALRVEIAGEQTEITKAELEAQKLEIAARVRKAFYDLLRNQDELLLHDEQAAIARQALEEARIKYVVGKVPQQDVLKAQIALTKLVEHLVMLQQEGSMASSRLNTPPDTLPSLLELEHIALNNRPELGAAASAIHQGEARVKLAEKGDSPDYNLSAGYMLMPDGARYRNTYMA